MLLLVQRLFHGSCYLFAVPTNENQNSAVLLAHCLGYFRYGLRGFAAALPGLHSQVCMHALHNPGFGPPKLQAWWPRPLRRWILQLLQQHSFYSVEIVGVHVKNVSECLNNAFHPNMQRNAHDTRTDSF